MVGGDKRDSPHSRAPHSLPSAGNRSINLLSIIGLSEGLRDERT